MKPTDASARPLVELHLHLEGALTAARARQLWSRAPSCPDPPRGGLGERAWSCEGLGGFLELFGWATRLLDRESAYVALLDDLMDALDGQGVIHAEIFVAIGQMHRVGVDPRQILPALSERAAARAAVGGVDVRFIADATRQWGVEAVERVVDDALELLEHRIVGFGMGGDETALPAAGFARAYARAAEAGLGITCHAGEGTTAAAVAEAIAHLGVRRVGHGIAAAHDPALVEQLLEKQVVLEICPGSNLVTGAWVPSDGPHPVLQLHRAGVGVVLGSDDPAYFDTSLPAERQRLREWGATESELDEMNRASVRAAFLSEVERARLMARIEAPGESA